MGAVNAFLGILIGATAVGVGLKSLDSLFLYTDERRAKGKEASFMSRQVGCH